MRRSKNRSNNLLGAQLAALFVISGCQSNDAEPPLIPIEQRTPKVLLIGIDGVRADVLAEVLTPNIDALAAVGSFTARTRTTTPSVSGPAWSSMLTGVWPEKHGVTSNDFTGRSYGEYPDFLTRIEQDNPNMATFAAGDWIPLLEIEGGNPTLSHEIDVRFPLDGYDLGWAEGDAEATSLAVRHLNEADPDAMFVYLGNPDETSHETGSIGSEYREAIALSDQHVGALVAAVRSRPSFRAENWLILISTDHGRTSDGDHGGDSPVEMTTFILASGPGTAIGTPSEETFIVDVAVTALNHLGIAIDPAWGLDGNPVGVR
jgi:predicted AlkP superfamily pyrophosphatase or phosphodiesterase